MGEIVLVVGILGLVWSCPSDKTSVEKEKTGIDLIVYEMPWLEEFASDNTKMCDRILDESFPQIEESVLARVTWDSRGSEFRNIYVALAVYVRDNCREPFPGQPSHTEARHNTYRRALAVALASGQ
ncbi:MAG: hypothetical protein ACYCY6_00850 [Minisyncoccota bacterium]